MERLQTSGVSLWTIVNPKGCLSMAHMHQSYYDEVLAHCQKCWEIEPNIYLWDKGPIQNLPFEFRILEFPISASRDMWTYATCCMSDLNYENPIELHIFSPDKDEGLVELLTTVTYYHRNTENLNINHTLNFGRRWKNKSRCDYGLISLPYLDGPDLENLTFADVTAKFYWLIPVTKNEVEYKKRYGVQSLEKMFDNSSFNYLDAGRKSIV
jgi:Suppressor of fused protein (SUFU)